MQSRYEHEQARRDASTRARAKVAVADTKKVAARRRALSWAVVVAVGAVLLLMLSNIARAATVRSARGYSISAPSGWTVNKSGIMGTDLILLAKRAGSFQPNINVVVRPAPRGVSLQQGRKDFESAYPRKMKNFRWLSRGNTKVAGEWALMNTATHTMQGRKLFLHQVVTVHRGTVYSFAGTSLMSQRAAFEPQFKAAFRSIKWTR